MLTGMWLFQKLKLFLQPTMTMDESHAITIIFNTILATVAVYFIVRKREALIRQLLKEIAHRKQLRPP